MRIDYLCNSLGKLPIYGLTITSNILTKYIPRDKELFKWQRFEYQLKGKTDKIKPKKVKEEPVTESEPEPDNEEEDLSKDKDAPAFKPPKRGGEQDLARTGKLSIVNEKEEENES